MKKSITSAYAVGFSAMLACWLIIVTLFTAPGHAATLSWSGGGATDNWGDSANWGGVGTPANGDTLIFGAIATAHLKSSNNVSGRVLNQIQFRGAAGGFNLYGQAISVTNSILATNSAGANTISNTVTVATADVTIQVSTSLKLAGQIAGTVGVTKTGAGVLIYQNGSSNPYNGTTRVNAGVIQLNVGGTAAFGGPLVIGDGTGAGSPTVQLLQSSEIMDSVAITINRDGTLDLNDFNETIGTSLTVSSATITTGIGTLTLQPNAILAVNDVTHVTSISGNLNVGSSSTMTIQGAGSLNIYAVVSGAASIVKNDSVNLFFTGANNFTGPLTANGSGDVDIANNTALGATNGATTINGSVRLIIEGSINVTNESLTMNSTHPSGAIWFATPAANASWRATNITLSADTTILVATNATLELSAPLTGSVGVIKQGPGTLTYSGATANTYSGATSVTDGTLLLAKTVSNGGVVGSALTIGDGTGPALSAVVRDSGAAQIGTTPDIIINDDGQLDLNNITEAVGNSLTLNSGEIQTGAAGLLALAANAAITNSGSSSISGRFSIGSGTCTIQGSGLLYLYADVSGSADILKNGSVGLYFTGDNTFNGLVTANTAGVLYLNSSTALGGTNFGTILNDNTYLYLYPGVNITNENLTLSTSASAAIHDFSGNTNTWIATNFTLSADAAIRVETNSWLLLKGPISGVGGITKTGPGTLALSGSGNNTYSGETVVNEGVLALDKAAGWAVGGGSLTIGDGVGGNSVDIVRYTGASGSEINTIPITINSSGLLDLNGKTDTIGTKLTLSDGEIQSFGGTLSVASNASITNLGSSEIWGSFSVGSGTCTIQGAGYLNLYADVSGSANIVKNGSVAVHFYGNNTFSGTLTANNAGYLFLGSPTALGGTNSGTILNDSTLIYLPSWGVNITNESLTLNTTANPAIYDNNGYSTNTWSATNFTLLQDAIILDLTNSVIELRGPIGGTGGVTKRGSGKLVYSGTTANTYLGLTTVNEGELDLNKSSVLAGGISGAGLIIGDGSGLDKVVFKNSSQLFNVFLPVTINSSGILDLNGYSDYIAPITMTNGTITGAGGLGMYGTVSSLGVSSISGSIFSYAAPVTYSNSGTLYIPATITGAYGIIKAGTGHTYLSASNSFAGPTVVRQGLLHAQNNWALGTTNSGTVVSNGASLVLDGGIGVTNESLTLNGPGPGDWGALDVESGVNTWAGPITNNADSTLDAWDPASQLHINGPISGTGGLELFGSYSGGGTHYFEGAAVNTYSGLTTVDATCGLVLNKSIFDGAIPGNLTINGTVRLLNGSQIKNTSNVSINSSGLLDLNGNLERCSGLSGSGNLQFGIGGYVIPGDFGTTSTFDGVASGDGYIWKVGGGVLTLNGNNTYLRQTFIEAGTLLVNGDQHQSSVAVSSGATLGGSGTVGAIIGNGNLAPGNSPGILNCSNVTFTATGIYRVELAGPNAGTDYDQLNVRGTNTLGNAGLDISLALDSPVAIGQQFIIIKNDGSDANIGTFLGYPEGANYSSGGYNLKLSYAGGSGNDVVLTMTSLPGAVVGSTVIAGNGSRTIDPNECNNVYLTLTNMSGVTMTGIKATLSTTTPGVVITQPYATYPNLAANGWGTNQAPFQISTLPSFVCGADIDLQLIIDSGVGPFISSHVLHSGAVSSTPYRYDNNVTTSIPDVGSIDSTNTVTSFGGPLEKVTVSLWLTHTLDSDLRLSLVSPDGTTVPLTVNIGAGANFGTGSADASRTLFDDVAGTPIAAGTPPFVGTYRPQGSLSNFFYNLVPNGDWRLRITDGFGGSLGTLRNWSLFLYGPACSAGGGACDYCLAPITGIVTNSDLIQSNRIARSGQIASCGTAKVWPGYYDVLPGLARHYDVYAFTNSTAADACVTVVLTSPGDLQAGVYLNGFVSSNIASNYVADSGDSTISYLDGINRPQSCSASIPPGATFFVTVNEITPGAGSTYSLQMSGLPCPPPTLTIQPLPANKARLSWDTSAGGYLLEVVPYLTVTNWTGITNEPIVSGGNYTVTNTIATPPNRFYRLHKP